MIKNKRGISYVMTAVWILALCMALSIILAYASMMTTLQMAADNTKLVLDSFVTHNSRLIYGSLKNGSDFTENLDAYFYKSALSEGLSLDMVGDSLYNKNEQGGVIYQISNPDVGYDERENTLRLKATYEVILPVEFAGKHLTDLHIPQKVTSYYKSYYNLK